MSKSKTFIIGVAVGACLSLFGIWLYARKYSATFLCHPREIDIRSIAHRYNGGIPQNSQDLYYFKYGFVDCEEYFALSLPDEKMLWKTVEKLSDKKRTDFKGIELRDIQELRTPKISYKESTAHGWDFDKLSDRLLIAEDGIKYLLVDEKRMRIYFFRY